MLRYRRQLCRSKLERELTPYFIVTEINDPENGTFLFISDVILPVFSSRSSFIKELASIVHEVLISFTGFLPRRNSFSWRKERNINTVNRSESSGWLELFLKFLSSLLPQECSLKYQLSAAEKIIKFK